MRPARHWFAGVAIAAALSACQREEEPELDEAAFEAMAHAVDDELNAAAAQIYTLLQSAAAQPQRGSGGTSHPSAKSTFFASHRLWNR